ncbi:MAG: energy-coupling factor transporter transmembrane component T [Actinobacteria bacterium]|nr:energy-coupling factor transporter transmembrane component T [Actinomycetota bacterium]
MIIVGTPLLLTLDWVSAALTLVLEASVLPFLLRGTAAPGRRIVAGRRVALGLVVVGVGAVMSGVVALLYARAAGRVWFEFGPATISDNSIELAVATTIRIAALCVPAVVLFATTDITDFADALAQHARAPERFVVGALAGMRTLQLASADLAFVRRARRARGVSAGGVRVVMPLLVLSLRRAETLSLSMEARGFDSDQVRTHYRTSVFTTRDTIALVLAVTIAIVSTGVSIATGAWSFVIN